MGAHTLVASKAGTPLDDSNVRRRFERLMASMSIKGVTRRTCATEMAAAGVPPKAIKSIPGHASYSTTASIYTHSCTEMFVKAAARVEWHINGT